MKKFRRNFEEKTVSDNQVEIEPIAVKSREACRLLNISTDLVTLTFESRAIRSTVIDGEPAWSAKDICDTLGYANASDAVSKHCRGVAKRYPIVDAFLHDFQDGLGYGSCRNAAELLAWTPFEA